MIKRGKVKITVILVLTLLFNLFQTQMVFGIELDTINVTSNTATKKQIQSSKIKVTMNNAGHYAIMLNPSTQAFYGGETSPTSNIDVRDDTGTYSWHDLPIEEFIIEDKTIKMTRKKDGVARYTLYLSIVNATDVGGYMKVAMEMENLKATPQDLGAFIYWDTMIDNNDGSPFEVIENGWRNYDGDFQVSAFFKDTMHTTNADAIWMGDWGNKGWNDNSPMTWEDHASKIGDTISTGDTAAGAWYDPVAVNGSESRTISCIIGVGPKNEPPVLTEPTMSPDIEGKPVKPGDDIIIGGKAGNNDDVGTEMDIVVSIDDDVYRKVLGTVTVLKGQTQEFEYTYTIPEGLSPGEHTLKVYLMDDTGVTSTLEAKTFYVPDLGPKNASININEGDEYTKDRSVTLTLGATNATEMMLSEDSDFADSNWESYQESTSFTLSSSDGEKIVYAKYRDALNDESSVVNDSIELDTVKPSTPTIETNPNKDKHNDDYIVTLIFGNDTGSGALETKYRTVEGTVYSEVYSEWITYSDPFIISEEGTSIVQAKTIDNAGNESNVASKSLTINKEMNGTLTIETNPNTQYSYVDYLITLITQFEDETVQESVYSTVYSDVYTDDSSDDFSIVYYKLNDSDFTIYDEPFNVTEKGQTKIVAKITDVFGNTSEEVTKTVYIYEDEDEDNDGVPNDEDPKPTDPNVTGKDTDGDGEDDGTDPDDDGDGTPDGDDPDPKDPMKTGKDTDGDGEDDATDPDDDGDGTPDGEDPDPKDPTKTGKDTDGDGEDDGTDPDDDGDGDLDGEDPDPKDPEVTRLKLDEEELEIIYQDGDSANKVSKDLGLLTEGEYGSEIIWESSHPLLISPDGTVDLPTSTTTVTLTATIKRNGQVLTKVFVVKLDSRPEIVLNGEEVVTLNVGELYIEELATAMDEQDGEITEINVNGYYNSKEPGVYKFTYTAIDSDGNASSVTRIVEVVIPKEATIPADDEEKIPDEEIEDAIEGAKEKGIEKIEIVVDEEVDTDNSVEVSISKEQLDNVKDNDISIKFKTDNASIEVPLDSVDTSDMSTNSRLGLVIEQVDISKGKNDDLKAAVKDISPEMEIYEQKVFDFTMKKIEETETGDVISEETIHYESDEDIILRMVIGEVPEGTYLMTFYYNPNTGEWEYIRGEYEEALGTMKLTTNHLSIYSVMYLSKEEKQEQLARLLNRVPAPTTEEIRNIIEDPTMEFDPSKKEVYDNFTEDQKNELADEILDNKPGAGYSYSTLKDEFDRLVDERANETNDNVPPVISLIGSERIKVRLNNEYVELGATAIDNIEGDISGRIVITTDGVDTTTEGEYTVRYLITDESGNIAEVTRTVVVQRKRNSSSSSGGESPVVKKEEQPENIEVVKGKEHIEVKTSSKDSEPKDKDMNIRGSVYDVQFNGGNEGLLRIKYDEEKVSNEDRLAVYVLDENSNEWKCLGGIVDKENNEILVDISKSAKVTVMEYNKTFKDLNGHWSKEMVEFLASRQIIEGYGDGNYRPDWGITRAEFATLITKVLGLEITTADTGFNDIKSDDWFAPYIAAARAAGVVSGVSDTEYEPHRIVSRQEMTAMVIRAYKNTKGLSELYSTINQIEKFSDDDEIGNWAKNDVYTAKYLEIVKGRTEKMFAPTSETTRAEAATLIYKFLKALDRI